MRAIFRSPTFTGKVTRGAEQRDALMRVGYLAFAFALFLSVGLASAQVRVDHADVIKVRDAELRVANGAASRGDIILSIPYLYIRTGPLADDARVISAINHAVRVPRGAPGFYAGTFGSDAFVGEVWCFFNRRTPNYDEQYRGEGGIFGDARERQCLLVNGAPEAIILDQAHPHLFSGISVTGASYVTMPRIVLAPIEIEPDLRLEFRLRRISPNAVHLDELAGGRRVRGVELSLTEGTAELVTIAGVFRISRSEENPRMVTVTRVS